MFFILLLVLLLIVVVSFVFFTQGFNNGGGGDDDQNGRKNRKRRSKHRAKHHKRSLSYYLKIDDFVKSFIQIPTNNLLGDSTTISSDYLAGRAPLYNSTTNLEVGTCSASFLCIQNSENIYTDIANYISTVDGLIVTWFTPTNLVNLELDSIINGMVTEAIVKVTTKVGASLYFGKTYDLIVSSDGTNINFEFILRP